MSETQGCLLRFNEFVSEVLKDRVGVWGFLWFGLVFYSPSKLSFTLVS